LKKIHEGSITITFILYFMILVVVPIIVIYVIFISVYQKIIIDNANELVYQKQHNVAGTLEKEIRTYNLMLAAIVYNTDSIILDQATALHRETDMIERYNLTESMDQRIELLMHAGENIDGLYFIYEGENSYYYYNNPLLFEVDEIKELELYKRALANENKVQKGNLVTDITTDSNGRYTLLFAVHPEVGVFRNDVEVVMLSAYTDVVKDNLGTKTDSKLGKMLIVNEEGMVMYSYDESHKGKNISQIDDLAYAISKEKQFYVNSFDGHTYIINTYDMENINWRIINLVDKSEITGQAGQVVKASIYIILAMIVFFILFSIFFFRGLINPINNLIIGMKNIENEEFDFRINISGNKEIRRLLSSFNTMAARIEWLVDENKQKEYEKVEAEVEALQSQINPHFITNVLSSIRLMALMSKNEGIKQMSERLIQILNASFRNSNRFNTVGEELELVKSYVYIMQIRYGNKFDVSYSVEPELLNNYMLKLILQPIVENSITHGLSEKEGQGNLNISVYKEGMVMYIEVRDDGVGMSEEYIKQVLDVDRRNKCENHHVGLVNVHLRIKLHHGDPYGIYIESKKGYYSKITYRLPLLNEEGEQK